MSEERLSDQGNVRKERNVQGGNDCARRPGRVALDSQHRIEQEHAHACRKRVERDARERAVRSELHGGEIQDHRHAHACRKRRQQSGNPAVRKVADERARHRRDGHGPFDVDVEQAHLVGDERRKGSKDDGQSRRNAGVQIVFRKYKL